MKHVEFAADLSLEPSDAFAAVTDFGRYAELTEAVRSIEQHDEDSLSTWSVNFRGGTLQWTERDDLDAQGLRLAFELVEGDFAEFHGEWAVDEAPHGARLRFTAAFDLGMPSLAAMIEPIAERTLLENLDAIVRGLFDDQVVATSTQAAGAGEGDPLGPEHAA